jgi:hypothetical protein
MRLLRNSWVRRRVPTAPAAAAPLAAIAVVAVVVVAAAALGTVAAASPRRLSASQAAHVSLDLDGDGVLESARLGEGRGGIALVDGDFTYTSRDKWLVVATALGDTDRNGLPEVVALLDGPDGRHVGLFAWFGGHYGERLVSAPLTPVPAGLKVRPDPAEGGDVLELTEEDPAGGGSGQPQLLTATYRWNGFGYTAVEDASAVAHARESGAFGDPGQGGTGDRGGGR